MEKADELAKDAAVLGVDPAMNTSVEMSPERKLAMAERLVAVLLERLGGRVYVTDTALDRARGKAVRWDSPVDGEILVYTEPLPSKSATD